MTVAVDAATEAVRTDTTSPFTFAHTGRLDVLGGVQGVIVACVHGTSSTDHVSAVSYGGVALTRAKRNTDTANEPGAAELWFVGSGLTNKGGLQTVSITCGATTDDFHFVVVTLTGATDLVVVDSDGLDNNVANPSVTLQYGGKTCMAFAALYGGGASPADFTPNANCTTVHDHDLGAFYSEVIRQTTAGSSDFAIGGTAGTDDVAFAAIAVGELNAYAYTGAGGATSAGAAAVSHDKVYPTSGGMTASGAAVVQFARTYEYQGAGGLDSDGAAVVSHDKAYAGAGGLAAAGAATLAHDKAYEGAGGAVLAGGADLSHGKVYVPAGGATLSGAAVMARDKVYQASGGIQAAGYADVVYEGGEPQQQEQPPAQTVTRSPGFVPRRFLGRVRKDLEAEIRFSFGGSATVEVVLGVREQPAPQEEQVIGPPPVPLMLPAPDYDAAVDEINRARVRAYQRRQRILRADANLLGIAA